jgi:hypothetical protein
MSTQRPADANPSPLSEEGSRTGADHLVAAL